MSLKFEFVAKWQAVSYETGDIKVPITMDRPFYGAAVFHLTSQNIITETLDLFVDYDAGIIHPMTQLFRDYVLSMGLNIPVDVESFACTPGIYYAPVAGGTVDVDYYYLVYFEKLND